MKCVDIRDILAHPKIKITENIILFILRKKVYLCISFFLLFFRKGWEYFITSPYKKYTNYREILLKILKINFLCPLAHLLFTFVENVFNSSISYHTYFKITFSLNIPYTLEPIALTFEASRLLKF